MVSAAQSAVRKAHQDADAGNGRVLEPGTCAVRAQLRHAPGESRLPDLSRHPFFSQQDAVQDTYFGNFPAEQRGQARRCGVLSPLYGYGAAGLWRRIFAGTRGVAGVSHIDSGTLRKTGSDSAWKAVAENRRQSSRRATVTHAQRLPARSSRRRSFAAQAMVFGMYFGREACDLAPACPGTCAPLP